MQNYKVTKTSTAVVKASSEKEACEIAKQYSNSGIFTNDEYKAWITLDKNQLELNFFDKRIEEGLIQIEDIPVH